MSAAPTVLVAEPSAKLVAACRLFLGGVAQLGFVATVDEAIRVVRGPSPPQVVVASVHPGFDGESLARAVRALPSRRVGMVLVYPADETRAAERAQLAQADALVMAPMKKQQVLGALQSTLKLLEVESGLAAAQAALAASAAAPAPRPRINTSDEGFFRKYLLLEVKRSRRYHYPVTLLLVAFDSFEAFLAEASEPAKTRQQVREDALSAVAAMLRDVDVSMAFGDDKLLVFLPHTPRSGGVVVSERLVLRLSQLDSFRGGTASVGLSAYDPKPQSQVSFASLVKEAMARLKTAQDQGGNRFEAGEASVGPKRQRISLG